MLRRHGAHNVAVVVLDNATGEWLAWEGSGDYFDADDGGTINGARRPAARLGAEAVHLRAGVRAGLRRPATVLPDVPSSFPTAEPGVVYSPRNYDGRYRGPLLARGAGRVGERPGGGACVGDRRARSCCVSEASAGFTTFDNGRVLRPRA
jgi:penicillin-binding protein 1C